MKRDDAANICIICRIFAVIRLCFYTKTEMEARVVMDWMGSTYPHKTV